jgi:3-isopropylmalate dehydratase small subunit
LELTDHQEIAEHAMEGVDPDFADEVETGDIVVAGSNFGCGSSREHAVICLKKSGVGAVIAKSFARIFYRNAVNMALPVIEVKDVDFKADEKLEIDMNNAEIKRENGSIIKFTPFPENILEIYEAGGVIPYYKARHS